MGVTVSQGSSYSVSAGGSDNGDVVLSGGSMFVLSGGLAVATTVSSGGSLTVDGTGTVSGTALVGGTDNSGTPAVEIISSGGTDLAAAVSSGGLQEVFGYASGGVVFGGTQVVEAGGTASGATVSSGGTLELLSGATASGFALLSGGALELGPGTRQSGFTVNAGITLLVEGAAVSATIVRSGGTLELEGGATQSGTTVSSGGTLVIGSGETLSGYTVSRGVTLVAGFGGTLSNTKVSSGGVLDVLSGGLADPTTVAAGGTAIVNSGGTAVGLIVNAGGTAQIAAGGLVSGSSPVSASGKGAALVIDGEIDAVGSGAVALGPSALIDLDGGHISGTVRIAAGATVNVMPAASAGALIAGSGKTISNGGTVNVSNGAALDLGGTINNAGIINLLGSSSATALLIDNAAGSGATFSGGGKIALGSGTLVNSIATDAPAAAAAVSATLSGSVTSGDSVALAFTNPLLFGLPEAITYVVQSGDTLDSVASGLASAVNSDAVLSNREISAVVSGGIVIISEPGGVGNMTAVAATVSGSGSETVTLTDSGQLGGGANVMLTNVGNTILGAGTIGDASLAIVNQAKGVIDATGSAAALVISTPGGVLQNAGTLEATKPGGLVIANTIVSNASTGVIAALGGPVNLANDLIIGGTLKTSGSGAIIVASNSFVSAAALNSSFVSFGAANVVELDGSGVNNPVKILGNLDVGPGGGLLLKGTIVDSGTITLSGPGDARNIFIDPSGATLTGGGKVVLAPEGFIINPLEDFAPASGSATLINAGDTIEGAGNFLAEDLTLINRGTVNANATFGGLALTNELTINSATLEATSTGALALDTRIVNSPAGVILASGAQANVFMTSTGVSGGTLQTMAGGQIGIVDSGNVFSSVINKGAVTLDAFIFGGATLDVQGAVFANSGSLTLSGAGALAAVLLDNDLTLSGSGTIDLSDAGSGLTALIASGGSAFTLTNAGNKIIGGGTIGGTGLTLINRSAGVINGNGSAHAMSLSATTSNAGLIEGTTSQGIVIAATVTNSKTIEAIGTNARVLIESVVTDASSAVIMASGASAHVDLGGATISGGTLKTLGSGALIEALSGSENVFSGGAVAVGSLLRVNDGGSLTLAGTITNSGTISAAGLNSDTDLYVGSGVLTLTGGGKVTLSPSEHNSIEAGAPGTVLINVNNTIAGAGAITTANGDLVFINSGTVNANTASALTINTSANQITNSGVLEATSTGGLLIESDVLNSKAIAALGTSAFVLISGHTVGNVGGGIISASGSSAEIELDGATIFGGTLRTSGAKAAIAVVSGDNAINVAAIGAGALVEVFNLATLTLSGGTAGAGATVEALSGGELFVEGAIANSGTLEALSGGQLVVRGTVVNAPAGVIVASGAGAQAALDGARISRGIVEAVSGGVVTLSGGTLGSATLAETLSGGTIFVSGALANSGTLLASASASRVEIVSGAVVSGGAVVVGNGIVDVLSGGTANVAFLSTGSGGLEIADSALINTSAFTGTVSGFGGANHTNHHQFIDLVSVTSDTTVSTAYTSTGPNNGTLTVTSGALHVTVAQINFVGHYTAANFSVTAGVSGTVAIVDPAVVNGGSVETGSVTILGGRQGDDFSQIAFGAQTTLAHSEDAGGAPTVDGDRHPPAMSLLRNYMAGSFVSAGWISPQQSENETPAIQLAPVHRG